MTALQGKVALVVGATDAQAGLVKIQDVGDVAVMLAIDGASSISGEIACVDGGLHGRA